MAKECCKDEEKVSPEKKKSVLTLFLLLFPSFILAIPETSAWMSLIKIMVFFYQAIMLKNFIDDHYRTG